MPGTNRFGDRPLPSPGRVLDQYTALGAVLLLSSLIALRYAAWPPVPGTDRATDAIVSAVTLAFAVLTITLGRRLPTPLGVDLPLVVAWGSAVVMAATRPLPQGQLLFGFPLVTLSVLAAYFLPLRRAIGHVVGMFTAYLMAVLATGDELAPFYAEAVCLTGVINAAAIGHLRRTRDRLLANVERQALLDPLTGALNRRGLEIEAPPGQSVASRAGQPTTVVAIDLDAFKEYNDTHGHAAGDALLVTVVREWGQQIRSGDRIARTGGDEFVLVLPGANEHATEQLLHRMRITSSAPWSAGYSFWHPDQELDEALRQADLALYEHKRPRRR
jgi:diguanylate cyclase (GGDEF)-like protein